MNSAARDPSADRETVREVHRLASAGDLTGAAAAALAALGAGLEHPLLLNVAALQLEREGRFEDACRYLRRAIELAPQDIGALNALGLCLQSLNRDAEALAHFDAVIALAPQAAFGHANRGRALLALGRIEEAHGSFHKALEHESNVAALAGLAAIATFRGDHSQARQLAEKVLKVEPNYPDAVMSIAAADLAAEQPQEAARGLRELLADRRVAPVDRAHALSMLGDVLDAQHRYAEAFAAYTESNEQLTTIYSSQYAGGETALEFTRLLTEQFQNVPPHRWAPSAPGKRATGAVRHVFLIGFPRSGTTLLEAALEGHPAIQSLEEQELMIDSVGAYLGRPEYVHRLAAAGDSELQGFRDAYWRRVRDAGIDLANRVFVDKYPLNTLKLPLIARLFPDAKILLARRDPRDVVLSCFRRRFRMNAPMFQLLSLDGAARFYDATMRAAEVFQERLKLELRVAQHEMIVGDFRSELTAICNWIGLDWTDAIRAVDQRSHKRAVVTPSTAQLLRGVDSATVGQWRHYAPQLASVLPILEPWVRKFGYDSRP